MADPSSRKRTQDQRRSASKGEPRRISATLLKSIERVGKPTLFWDCDLKGFGLKVTPSGNVTFIVQYRTQREGTSRRLKIGSFGKVTPDAARAEAKRIFGLVAQGEDPARDRMLARKAATVAEAAKLYLEQHARPRKKSADQDERLLRIHILPRIGKRHVATLTRSEVATLHHQVSVRGARRVEVTGDDGTLRRYARPSGGPVLANRCLALLSSLLAFCEAHGMRPEGSNPVRGIRKFHEEKRGRLLRDEELARLGAALAEAEHNGRDWPMLSEGLAGDALVAPPAAVAALRFLALTGCRKSEALGLRWDWFDAERGVIEFPDSKTGAKITPLGTVAVDVLQAQPRVGPFVFASPEDEKKPLSPGGLTRIWHRIRAKAGLDDVRVHDLRHNLAGQGVSSGATERMVGQILGHRSPATTRRYSHLADHPVRAEADRISRQIAAKLAAAPKIVAIGKRGKK